VTIADFVADARAPTPTAAAELLSPHQDDWLATFARHEQHLARRMRDRLRQAAQRADYLAARLVHPRERVQRLAERFAAQFRHLQAAQLARFAAARQRLGELHARLQPHNPLNRIQAQLLRAGHDRARLIQAIRHRFTRTHEQLAQRLRTLDALSPLATLARGYAIAETADHRLLRSAEQVAPGDPLRIRVARGAVDCRVETVHDKD
jgi:exodeoxyribonuclease VII large subunit